jgi:hypothetical protein
MEGACAPFFVGSIRFFQSMTRVSYEKTEKMNKVVIIITNYVYN